MKISVLDGSHYFKGLLLLVRKDHMLSAKEIELMLGIGKSLGFEKEFCENAIQDILANTYIDDTPSQFTSKGIAEKFIRDGLRIAFSDGSIHPAEEEWLRLTAEANGLSEDWFHEQKIHTTSRPMEKMEVNDLTLEHLAPKS